ncbi:MAG TPA: hypothetical protein VMB28_36725 [Mycobacterium sp.]|nr:hypothetical protein [Mycobacterium sp.]HTH90663.1 hypothetical protein [Mycobacterium sp.]
MFKHPEEFGRGAIAGVAGPESANNASSTSACPAIEFGSSVCPRSASVVIDGRAPARAIQARSEDVVESLGMSSCAEPRRRRPLPAHVPCRR